ncbi:MAG: hypothetical protein JNM82_07425 [Rhodocyclaceae bacterium]|nr:hypothetical protein [Rhodocyclaceae bacterium]
MAARFAAEQRARPPADPAPIAGAPPVPIPALADSVTAAAQAAPATVAASPRFPWRGLVAGIAGGLALGGIAAWGLVASGPGDRPGYGELRLDTDAEAFARRLGAARAGGAGFSSRIQGR